MKKVTDKDIIERLRKLPEEQKINLALQANIKGIDIERQIVPALVNITNVYAELAEKINNNYKLMLGENYKFLNK